MHRFLTHAQWAFGLAALVCLATAGALVADRALAGANLPATAELWSAERVEHWRASAGLPGPTPNGRLKIAALNLDAPIYPDDGIWALNRGLGVIGGNAGLDLDGNIGIAGHRDGFFRVLKDVKTGQRLELQLDGTTRTYMIEMTHIVKPTDTWVLEHVEDGAITLVTCYPFYFAGSAPERFIVRAYPVDA